MFEASRFGRLLAVHWAEHGRGYLWFFAIGIAVHLCVWLLFTQAGTSAHQYSIDMQIVVYVVGYILTAVLFAVRHFAGLSSRESALTWLMRPASFFEKGMLAWLMVAVFYPLAYTLAFQVCNVPGALLGEVSRDALLLTPEFAKPDAELMRKHMAAQAYGPYIPFASGKDALWLATLLLGITGIQALILVGMLYFQRMAWLKTLVAMFILLVLALPLFALVLNAAPDRLFLASAVHAGSPGINAWAWILWLGVPASFWASMFLFIRERELQ